MRKHAVIFLVSAVLAFLLTEVCSRVSWGRFLEFRLRSLLYRLNVNTPGPYDIVVVAIDEKSFAALKSEPSLSRFRNLCWPWPPALHAEILNRLGEAGAAKVGFDLLFSESFDDLYLPQYASFAPLLQARDKFDLPIILGGKLERGILTKPADKLLEAGFPWGLANSPVNFANEVWQYDFFQTGHPSFALAVAEAEGGRRELDLLGWNRQILEQRQWLSFRHAAEQAFPCISYTDVLLGYLPEDIRSRWGVKTPRELFSGKTVLLGRTSLDAHDIQVTPMGFMPGVVIHAHALQMLHKNSAATLHETTPTQTGMLTAGSILACGGVAWLVNGLTWWLLSGVLMIIYLWVAFYALSHYALILPFSGVLFGWIFLYLIQNQFIARLAHEERQFIQGVFGKYVSPVVAAQLLADPARVKLGGEDREITILFSDIADFTTISEKLPPQQLIQLLNRFLGLISREILHRQGTLDKYIGDAIMAFWNAPLDLAGHAELACQAALGMQQKAAEFNRNPSFGPIPLLSCRIGINTGRAIVGNAGSEERFSYTAVGDAVNTASRYEGLGKLYGVSIIIGEATCRLVQGKFAVRLLDRVKVKGKSEPTEIYELMGPAGAVPEEFLDSHTKALNAYFNRSWDAAFTMFQRQKETYDDGPARTFLKRLEEIRKDPQAFAHFDGTWVIREK